MRFPLAVSAAAVVAIAIAACSGGQQPVYTPPPSGSVASPGALALTGYGQAQSIGTASGITGTLTYIGGTGSVTATSRATAPAGTTTVSPNDRVRVEASSSPTSPNVYYVTTTGTAAPHSTAFRKSICSLQRRRSGRSRKRSSAAVRGPISPVRPRSATRRVRGCSSRPSTSR